MLIAGSANAGPDSTTNHFMNTRATMFDVGLLRLDRIIQGYQGSSLFHRHMTLGKPLYIWDDDIIQIDILYSNLENLNQRVVKEECKNAIENVQSIAMVNTDGEYEFENWSRFANAFSHNGFSFSGESELLIELDKKFLIICSVFTDRKLQVRYKKKLMGSSISAEEY